MTKVKRGFTAKVIGRTGMGLAGLMQSAAQQQKSDVQAFEKKQQEKESNGTPPVEG